MKKLLSIVKKHLSIVLLVGTTLSSLAQSFQSQSFFKDGVISSIMVSNKFFGLTNLDSYGTGYSNAVGQIFTNALGNQITITNDSSSLSNFIAYNFIKDVNLWSDRNGGPLFVPGTNSAWVGVIGAGYANINIRLYGQSGANAAVNFRFVGVPDGVNKATAPVFTVGVTAVASSWTDVYTNVPMQNFIGCKSLRLEDINNVDVDATSAVFVNSVTLNGFVP